MMQPTVVFNGKTWYLFSADYDAQEAMTGKSSFYFYALSLEHAHLVLDDIKSTAVLRGQIDSFIPSKLSDQAADTVAWWCRDLITQEVSIITDANHAKARSAAMYQGAYIWDVHPLCFAAQSGVS